MQNFIFRLERIRLLRRLKHRWECNIKMDFMKVKYEAMAYCHVSHDWNQWRGVVNMVMNVGLY
jgi:hypothetical protein